MSTWPKKVLSSTLHDADVLGLRFDPRDRDGWHNSQQVTMSRRVRVQSEAAAKEAAVAAHHDRAR